MPAGAFKNIRTVGNSRSVTRQVVSAEPAAATPAACEGHRSDAGPHQARWSSARSLPGQNNNKKKTIGRSPARDLPSHVRDLHVTAGPTGSEDLDLPTPAGRKRGTTSPLRVSPVHCQSKHDLRVHRHLFPAPSAACADSPGLSVSSVGRTRGICLAGRHGRDGPSHRHA